MVTRRRLATAVLAVASSLAGCGSDVLPDGATPSSTEPPTSGGLTPPPCPERPDPVTTDGAGAFVRAFERAYAWHVALDRFEDPDDLTVHVGDPTVESAAEGGVLVSVDVFVSVTTDGTIGDDEHVASYHLADGETLRVAGNDRSDPTAEGEPVECPPE